MPTTSEDQQRAAVRAVQAAAAAELSRQLAYVALDDSAAIAEFVVDGLPGIAESYGLALATLAADWYDSLRDEALAGGDFEAVLADLPSQQRWRSMAGWITAGDKTEVETLIQGGVQRTLADMHRGTVMASAVADPGAEGWARFARPGACGFCLMLTMRGGVYSDSTAKFGSHDHCSCMAGPVWKGPGAASRVKAYQRSAKRGGTGDEPSDSYKRDMARAREWMRENDLI